MRGKPVEGGPANRAGGADYRSWVGDPHRYDVVAASQFGLLTQLGLREHHHLLDIGCGSLRGGRLFIPYLLPGRYYGIEPQAWLIEEGIRHEVGRDLVRIKRPTFAHVADFRLTVLGRRFDYVLAQSVFSHASQAQIRRCLEELVQVLAPTGMFVATFLEGTEDYEEEEWVYPECVPYRRESMERLVSSFGLRFATLDWPHPAQQRWFLAAHADIELPRPDADLRLRDRLRRCEDRVARVRRHPAFRAYAGARSLFGRRPRSD